MKVRKKIIMLAAMLGVMSIITPAMAIYADDEITDAQKSLTDLDDEIPDVPILTEIITGDGFTFNPETKLLTITTDTGTTEWRYNENFAVSDVHTVIIDPAVAAIGDEAFYGCDQLTDVTLPESLLSIGVQAFYGCESLVNITIPDDIISIGEDAFDGCTSLVIDNTTLQTAALDDRSIEGDGYTFDSKTGTLTISSNSGTTNWRSNPIFFDQYNNPDYSPVIKVIIGNTVTELGKSAFSSCRMLKNIDLSNVTSIGMEAFNDCSGLEYIDMPNVTSIGMEAFNDCTSLEKIDMPNVTSIGTLAFYNCSRLENIDMPNVISIADGPSNQNGCFFYCTRLKSVNMPKVTSIGKYAFQNCFALNSVTMPNVSLIGDFAFYHCGSLTDIVMPASITSIGASAFEGSNNLVTITMPDSVASLSIGNSAFKDCVNLKNFVIPAGTVSIGDNAFNMCRNLTAIVLPDSLTALGNYAFAKCNSLADVKWPTGSFTIGDYAFSETGLPSSSQKLPGNATHIGNDQTSIFKDCTTPGTLGLPPGTTTIDDEQFFARIDLINVVIPDGITSIGKKAFSKCTNLKSIVIPDTVTFIDTSAFEGCSSLTNVTLSKKVTAIKDNTFIGCSSLTSISVPDSVTSIGDSAFYGCENLVSISVPDSVTSISDSAFYGCISLTNVTLPDQLTSIEQNAFYQCMNLNHIQIPKTVTYIGWSAFAKCTFLTDVTFESSSLSFGDYAFSYTGLTKEKIDDIAKKYNLDDATKETVFKGCPVTLPPAIIPENTTVIPERAFYKRKDIENITIPNKVEKIGNHAFYGCSNLTSITIPDSVKKIGDYAFSNTGLTEIIIPETVESIGIQAFTGSHLQTIIFNSVTAPNMGYKPFGDNNYNILIYVPHNGTGYSDISGRYTVCVLPTIGPETVTLPFGETAAFYIHSFCYSPDARCLYQWQKMDSNGQWQDINGATDSIYRINPVAEASAGTYRCKVTLLYGSPPLAKSDMRISNEAVLELGAGGDTYQKINEWLQPLTIKGWQEGKTPNAPSAVPKYGAETVVYTYSNQIDGTYTATVPTASGTWYVKATVAGTNEYTGLEHTPVAFVITPSSSSGDDNKPGGNKPGSTNRPSGGNSSSGENTGTPDGTHPGDPSQGNPDGTAPGNPSQGNPGGTAPGTPSLGTSGSNAPGSTQDSNDPNGRKPSDLSQKDGKSEGIDSDGSSDSKITNSDDGDGAASDKAVKSEKIKKYTHRINILLLILIAILCIIRILIFVVKRRKDEDSR